MRLNSLKDLYISELEDIYDAENRMMKVLPKLAKACSRDELKSVFHEQLDTTRRQQERLERIFGMLDRKPSKRKCDGIRGIIDESQEFLGNSADPRVLDAAIITSTQRLKHYEMCVYGCLRSFAQTLGFKDQADLLQETLDEEGDTDHRLTNIAESVNMQAVL
ncbi:MAG: ferritin-like domain-containing protein [bacterium]